MPARGFGRRLSAMGIGQGLNHPPQQFERVRYHRKVLHGKGGTLQAPPAVLLRAPYARVPAEGWRVGLQSKSTEVSCKELQEGLTRRR